ncbi:MAG: sporulation protein YqfD, partial [Clostridia bacterium]|nr:sporulation protein YqfD [Clostridia bacterium]
MIKVEGLALERLLNAALREGVRLSAVRRLSPTELVAKIRPKDLSLLRGIRRKYACRIRIVKKSGAVFAAGRLKMRKVLLFGWIPLLLAMFLLSRFVWFVEVTGCSRIPEEEVYALLEGLGIQPGIASAELDHYAISRALSAQDARIAWAGTSRKGVVLTVSIVEAEQIPSDLGEEEPCSLYAAKDGVINSITALKGRSAVTAGQTVKKGDLLITGELTSEAG